MNEPESEELVPRRLQKRTCRLAKGRDETHILEAGLGQGSHLCTRNTSGQEPAFSRSLDKRPGNNTMRRNLTNQGTKCVLFF